MRHVWVFFALIAVGCDQSRIEKLEQQNAALSKEVEALKKPKSAPLELQARCGQDAEKWFNSRWDRDKETILLDYSAHYSVSRNKCFVGVQYNYRGANFQRDSEIFKSFTITNVYENIRVAELGQRLTLTETQTFHCDADGIKCSSPEEFNPLAARFMVD